MDNWAEVNVQDEIGATPLHRAASKGNMRSMAHLLHSNMCSVNTQDKQGNTPLYVFFPLSLYLILLVFNITFWGNQRISQA